MTTADNMKKNPNRAKIANRKKPKNLKINIRHYKGNI
jgi:hypothetical protein